MGDTRKRLSYSVTYTGGQFYNGILHSLIGGITLRSRPHFNLIFQAEYDKLQFPGAYGSSELFLLSPKIEYNLVLPLPGLPFCNTIHRQIILISTAGFNTALNL
jgi:hypothetical protein